MNCPRCNSVRVNVIETRPSQNNTVRRRRECYICKHRFTTYETVATEYKER